MATFFGHRCRFYSFHSFTRVSPIIPGMQKNCRSSWGPLFVGAPVRPNMLNMPKSAADTSLEVCWLAKLVGKVRAAGEPA